jgi:hypothetical protein
LGSKTANFLLYVFNWYVYKNKPRSLENVKDSGRDVKSIGQNPGFQCAICTTGEEPVVLADVDLHDSSSNVSEYGLLSMFILK